VGDNVPPPRTRAAPRRLASVWVDIGAAVGVVAAATSLAHLAAPITSAADVVLVFLLGVLLAAFGRGRTAATLAAALSVGAYNFFFVPPFHTFAVADPRNLLTFAVLFGVGLAASGLADRLRRQESEAVARETRTAALLSLTRATAEASDEVAVARAIVTEAGSRIADGAALYVVVEDGSLVCLAAVGPAGEGELEHVQEAHRAGAPVTPEGLVALPIVESGGVHAVLVLRTPVPGTSDLAEAWTRQTALALARVRHARTAEEATLRARTEELRSALLSTVSHDLRTPLAAITGAATTLLDGRVVIPTEARRELLTSIRDEAARLERLVSNLLEMTRLVSGALTLRPVWVPLDEVVGAAFAHVGPTLRDHPTRVDVPADLPLVELDPVVFEQVLVNLLENAGRHTPPGTPIRLTAQADRDAVTIEVADAGPGFRDVDLTRLFDPFVRGRQATAPGSGLGLAICRGIVLAHGGTIEALRPVEGGAAIVVHLPRRREPPTLPADADADADEVP
jgi:two-component system sensor histidine kinase KdpD